MTEANLRMIQQIGFELMPTILVIADFLAGTADRQERVKLFDLGSSVLQFSDSVSQRLLQFDDPAAHVEPGAQFIAVERLDDIVVGAVLKTGNDISRGIPTGEQDDIGWLGRCLLAQSLANVD